MTQVPLSPFDASDAQDQVLAFSNLLSAYYSIPLIESIYDNGFSIKQLSRIKTVFEILISANRHSDAFMFFISLYQHFFKKRPLGMVVRNTISRGSICNSITAEVTRWTM